jgi:predicted DNA repair protein MutK
LIYVNTGHGSVRDIGPLPDGGMGLWIKCDPRQLKAWLRGWDGVRQTGSENSCRFPQGQYALVANQTVVGGATRTHRAHSRPPHLVRAFVRDVQHGATRFAVHRVAIMPRQAIAAPTVHVFRKESKNPLGIGLLALLDDVAAIAKVAAASLDDVVSQAAKAGAKAAAVVVDDAAVTPRYVVGFVADRELPIVGKIAVGSLRNKLLILLPCTLALSYFLPWMITPLLMFGGVYLCYEGTEKVVEAIVPHRVHAHKAELDPSALNPHTLEEEKIAGAIKTDFILSAEIMAITLAAVPDASIVMQALVLALVGTGITVAVYGVVALIVKADDVGVALASNDGGSMTGGLCRAIGRALVLGMPGFLTVLGAIGTAAMIWVGGAIIVHGFEVYGLHSIGHAINSSAEATAHALPFAAGAVKWTVVSFLSGMGGLLIGAASIPLVGFAFTPAWKLFKTFYASAKGRDRGRPANNRE